MPSASRGRVDCDIHPTVPKIEALLPYLPGHWAEATVNQGFNDLETYMYPVNAPITARADWRPKKGKAGTDLEQFRKQALDPFDIDYAIMNCVYGTHLIFNRDMAVAFASAVNDWMAKEWLDREKRLRASIVVPLQDPVRAAEEIEKRASDKRFVQVLMPTTADQTLGKPFYWPIYEAAQKHGLPIGIHAGSSFRYPMTNLGWCSYQTEDYVAVAGAFQGALASLISEGAFGKFPELKFVMIESGFTWLPACAWRLDKYWHALRMEIPWVTRSPLEIIRDQVRFTLQPVDAPPTAQQFERFLNHMGSDELLLFSTDYPHWQFDGDEVLPKGMSAALAQKIQFENPYKTYRNLQETVQ